MFLTSGKRPAPQKRKKERLSERQAKRPRRHKRSTKQDAATAKLWQKHWKWVKDMHGQHIKIKWGAEWYIAKIHVEKRVPAQNPLRVQVNYSTAETEYLKALYPDGGGLSEEGDAIRWKEATQEESARFAPSWSAALQRRQERIEAMDSGTTFEAKNNMTPRQIAKGNKVSLDALLLLNQRDFPNMQANSRLRPQTLLRLPLADADASALVAGVTLDCGDPPASAKPNPDLLVTDAHGLGEGSDTDIGSATTNTTTNNDQQHDNITTRGPVVE